MTIVSFLKHDFIIQLFGRFQRARKLDIMSLEGDALLESLDSCSSFRILSRESHRQFVAEYGWDLFDKAHEYASSLADIDGEQMRDLMNLIVIIAGKKSSISILFYSILFYSILFICLFYGT